MIKPGIKTTEFWLVVVVGVLTNLGTIEVPDKWKWIVNLGLVVGYAISRGLAKYETTPEVILPPITPVDPVGVEMAEQEAIVKAAKPTRKRKAAK